MRVSFTSNCQTRAELVDTWYSYFVNGLLEPGLRVTKVSFALNAVLAMVKLFTGIVGHSYALIADAVESMGDIFSSLIVWGGLTIASRPADENHPYGHGKAEPLAALAVAIMLVAAAGFIAMQAVGEIRMPHQSPAPYTLVVLLGVVVIKEAMYRYGSQAAKRIGSTAVIADAWHHRSDAITSAAVAVGIAISLVGGEGYEAADDWAALVACLVIVANGFRFVRFAVGELMDTSPGTTLVEDIRTCALEVEGARLVEKVLVRKAGPFLYVDLHLEVDPTLTVHRAHQIGHAVKDMIITKWPRVSDVLVHIEPHKQPS